MLLIDKLFRIQSDQWTKHPSGVAQAGLLGDLLFFSFTLPNINLSGLQTLAVHVS